MKHYVGLDVSLKEVSICVVDADGTVITGEAEAPPHFCEPRMISLQMLDRLERKRARSWKGQTAVTLRRRNAAMTWARAAKRRSTRSISGCRFDLIARPYKSRAMDPESAGPRRRRPRGSGRIRCRQPSSGYDVSGRTYANTASPVDGVLVSASSREILTYRFGSGRL